MSRENMNQPELGNGLEVSGGSPRPPEICSGDEQSIIGTPRYRLRFGSVTPAFLHATSAVNCY